MREARAISYFQGWIRPFQGYTFENPQRPSLLVTLSISRLANTKCCDREWPISFFFSFLGPVGTLWLRYYSSLSFFLEAAATGSGDASSRQ